MKIEVKKKVSIPVHFTKEQLNLINSPAFKKWFDGSKIVDSNGFPLQLYHGTNKEFFEFKKGEYGAHGQHYGSFFTDDYKQAKLYAEQFRKEEGMDPRIIPVFLSLKNPNRAKLSDLKTGFSYLSKVN